MPIPREHREGQSRWVYPVMDAVIEGIERGDKASIAIGIDFVEEDARFPFGKTLKSNTARALRQAPLTARTSWTHSKPCDKPAIGRTDPS